MILPLRVRAYVGRGKVFYDVNFNVLVAQKIHLRYLGNLEHPIAHELIDAINKGQSVVLEISPKYYSTWNIALGLATYSNSESTVMSCASIFENLWAQSTITFIS
jgi:hypothetical protein